MGFTNKCKGVSPVIIEIFCANKETGGVKKTFNYYITNFYFLENKLFSVKLNFQNYERCRKKTM